MNLINNLTSVFTTDVVSRIAAYTDESTEKTGVALNSLVYTIIGGLMKRTTSEIGVNQLYNHLQKGRYDGSLFENLSTLLRDPSQTNTLISHGNEVISHLLPALKSSIGSMIASYARIRNSSAISLLGITATIVLNALGKLTKDQKLDADGLANMLFSERDSFFGSIPEDFLPILVDRLSLQQIVGGSAIPARRTSSETPAKSTPAKPTYTYDYTDTSDNDNNVLTKWGFGALVAIALAAGVYYVYQNTQKYSGETASDVTTQPDTSEGGMVARSLNVPKDSTSKAISPTTTLATSSTPTSGLAQQLTPYLTNPMLPKGRVFPLPGITFTPGSLSLTPASQGSITELATLLKTFPQLQIQLVGYANDAALGMTNKALSFKRVNLIKQQLVTSGINYLRVDAIGRGTGVPLRDTSRIPKPTLRKIDMKVIVK